MSEEEKVSHAPKNEAELLGRLEKLEARVTELNDKLTKVHITEEEWKAYQKVSSVLGEQSATPSGAPLGHPPVGVPVTPHCVVILHCACIRCGFIGIVACGLPLCQKGDGTKSGPDFSGFGGFP